SSDLAIYKFTASRILRLPTTITVADSAGQLIANFRLANASEVGAMSVDVMGNDIILQGETPRGLLTLVLYRANAADVPSSFIGYWSLGNDEHGELRVGSTNHHAVAPERGGRDTSELKVRHLVGRHVAVRAQCAIHGQREPLLDLHRRS